MKRQSKSYWCGIASIANALEVLGIRRSQREIARLCHVSPQAGTSEEEMVRALLANGMAVDPWQSEHYGDAWNWLEGQLGAGPAILCVDDSAHWVTAIGYCGDSVIVFDPSRNMGVEVHDAASLSTRWRDSEDGFYGIGVSLVG